MFSEAVPRVLEKLVPQSGTVECARPLWRVNGECRLGAMLDAKGDLSSEGGKGEKEGVDKVKKAQVVHF